MKQGLSLRVSQHLALTPQLQQSIRLLQLSTLELSQEVEQMLDDNPFLELTQDEPVREDSGPATSDAVPAEREIEFGDAGSSGADESSSFESDNASSSEAEPLDWGGDGTTEVVADDTEWGGDATARQATPGGDDEVDATDLAFGDETLQSHLHRQAASLRLGAEDRCALEFLIESLNEDGYLDEPLESLAAALAKDDVEQIDELVHRFTVALRLMHHLEPAGVGARSLAECLTLQLEAIREAGTAPAACATALRICAQP